MLYIMCSLYKWRCVKLFKIVTEIKSITCLCYALNKRDEYTALSSKAVLDLNVRK